MKIKQLGAMALGSVMALSTMGFAASLADYPQPFITDAGSDNFLIVVGNAAAPSDVVGAIDIAARLGGETGSDVSVSGGVELGVSGEGRAVATTNTKIFIDDAMGKTGLRTTMTKDDMAVTLATEIFQDSDASLNAKYNQYIFLTPSDNTCAATAAASESYCLQWERPSTTATMDPSYSFGRFPTSPTSPLTTSDYFYRTYVSFEKNINASGTGEGDVLSLFGKLYTIHSDTAIAGTPSPAKLVLSGGASDTILLNGGETTVITISDVQYEVTYVASSSATTGIVKVGTDQDSITQGQSKTVGGLDVFMKRVFDISSTDPALDSAILLLGADKLILSDGSKVKKGANEDSVDGTYVNISIASDGTLSGFYVYTGAKSSSDDYLKIGSEYLDPVWKSFKIRFDSITPELTDTVNRDMIKITPSGDNLLQVTMTDDRGYEKTLNWAYKSSSTGTAFSLADNAGNQIHAREILSASDTLARDEYFTVDAGDFTHYFRLSGMSVDGTSSSNLELTDQFSGTTTKVTLGTDNDDTKIIDGQTYYIRGGTSTVNITWGTGASLTSKGLYDTLMPTLKTRKGAHVAFYPGEMNVSTGGTTPAGGLIIQLPTGAINVTTHINNANEHRVNITAVNKEDSTASVIGSVSGNSTSTTEVKDFNLSSTTNNVTFTLGRTSTGGLRYFVKANTNQTLGIKIASSTTALENQPGIIIVEERDDSSNVYSAYVTASTETSGSNSVAIPSNPVFTSTASGTGGVALGTDSTMTDYADLYGLYARKTTSGQDTLTLYYPDDQVTANIFVLDEDSTVTTGGGTGGTVHSSTPIKNAVAKLDTEVTNADQTTKNVILVGGPAVNTLVADLAAAGKTKDVQYYRDQGAGYALINWVADAFATGKTALVVAGHSAGDTRTVTGFLQKFEDHATEFAGKSLVEYRNGVLSTTTS